MGFLFPTLVIGANLYYYVYTYNYFIEAVWVGYFLGKLYGIKD